MTDRAPDYESAMRSEDLNKTRAIHCPTGYQRCRNFNRALLRFTHDHQISALTGGNFAAVIQLRRASWIGGDQTPSSSEFDGLFFGQI